MGDRIRDTSKKPSPVDRDDVADKLDAERVTETNSTRQPRTPVRQGGPMSDLQRPRVALLVAPDASMWRRILNDEKRITIRQGHRDYRVGDEVLLCCTASVMTVKATITDVRHTTLAGVTTDEFRDDGYRSRDHMRTCLRRYYPDLDWESPVTVIRWEPLEGRLFNYPILAEDRLREMRERY